MKNENMTSEEWDEQVVGLPVSAVLGAGRKNRYGSVPGLDDEELADPDELERQIVREAYAPVLMLRRPKRRTSFCPEVDERGEFDGAFGTKDFERSHGKRDKSRSVEAALRERLKDIAIQASVVHHRFRVRAKYRVLRCMREGIIEIDHIVHEDMRALAMLEVRSQRVLDEIRDLRKRRERREHRKRQAIPCLAGPV